MIRFSLAVVATLALGVGMRDDVGVRHELQVKYDQRTASATAKNSPFQSGYSTRYRQVGIDKSTVSLSQLNDAWNSTAKSRLSFSQIVHVDSADILEDRAKAAVQIDETEVLAEAGKSVRYERHYTAQDTWVKVDVDWYQIETRITRASIKRNGKTVSKNSERVKTDFERQYGPYHPANGGHG